MSDCSQIVDCAHPASLYNRQSKSGLRCSTIAIGDGDFHWMRSARAGSRGPRQLPGILVQGEALWQPLSIPLICACSGTSGGLELDRGSESLPDSAVFSFVVQIGFVAFDMARALSSSLGRARIVSIFKCGGPSFRYQVVGGQRVSDFVLAALSHLTKSTLSRREGVATPAVAEADTRQA
jgi:hypothetical protein